MLHNKLRVLDGGLGSFLESMGCSINEDSLWTARTLQNDPKSILKAHTEFLKSGAEILITSSYQASTQGFTKFCNISEDDSILLMKKSVTLAQQAINEFSPPNGMNVIIGGSIGPYGACLGDRSEYTGSYMHSMSLGDLKQWHRPRIEALISAGVDFLAVETIPSLDEALCILEVIKEFPSTKAWVTFSCKDGHHTSFGDNYSKAFSSCYSTTKSQLIGIGINCTPPIYISSLLKEAAAAVPIADVPRIVYPNAEEVLQTQSSSTEPGESAVFAESNVKEWIALGATVIGGCCGVQPSEIEVLSHILQTY